METLRGNPRLLLSALFCVLACVGIVTVLPMVSNLHPADAGLVATPVLVSWGLAIARRQQEFKRR
jgi:hypothetical protein